MPELKIHRKITNLKSLDLLINLKAVPKKLLYCNGLKKLFSKTGNSIIATLIAEVFFMWDNPKSKPS